MQRPASVGLGKGKGREVSPARGRAPAGFLGHNSQRRRKGPA